MARQFEHRGGLTLANRKAASAQGPIRQASAPAVATMPLQQQTGPLLRPCVRVGDRVLIGQLIAEPDGLGTHLHAPISGKVIAIEPRSHRDHEALSIVIDNDGHAHWVDRKAASRYQSMSPTELRLDLARGGLVGLGGAGFPTATKLEQGAAAHVKQLILNGAESEPYISCDQVLMQQRADRVLAGAQILLHALQADRCFVAIEDDKPQALAAMRAAAAQIADSRISLVTLPSIYPAGWEGQLITALTNREIPRGRLPADIGVICYNVATAAAAAAWVLEGEPLIRRIVTVAGGGVHRPLNLDAYIGTPIAQLIDECGGYREDVAALIIGGSMMGLAVPADQIPLVKATNCVLAPVAAELSIRQTLPCIRCGDCSQVCPAGLLPQQLDWHARKHNVPALAELGLWDCIECGCCDYVCPSQIPLADNFRRAKERMPNSDLSSLHYS